MIRGSLWTLISALSGIPVGFATNLVVARALGPVDYGTLGTFAAVLTAATTVLNLGVSQATVQWIAESRDDAYQPQRLRLLRNCVGYHALLEGPIVALLVYFLLRSGSTWEWVLGVAAAFASQAIGTSSVILTATARNATAAKLSIVSSVVLQIVTIVSAVVARSPITVYSLQLAAGLLGPVLCFMVLGREDRAAFRRPLILSGLPPGFMRYGLGACGAALVANLVYGRSEVFILKLNRFQLATGIFTLATGLAGQITVPMDSVMGPLLPTAAGKLAKAPQSSSTTAVRSLKVANVLAALTMATAIPSVYFLMPSLFGLAYKRAQFPFLALGLVSCVQSITVPLSMLIMARRNAKAIFQVNVVSLAIDAIVAVVLIPFLGLWGAVIANGAAQMGSIILLLIVSTRHLEITGRRLIGTMPPLALGGVAALASVEIVAAFGVGALIGALLTPVLGLGVLAFGLRLRPDWRISRSDSDLVENVLPSSMRSAYRGVSTVLCLVAR